MRDAIKAGDRIRAVIRNTGLNQDGKTAGITMPSGDAQEALIRTVYDSAGLDPSETGYIESHGTGTATGDPIEAAALGAIFGNRNRTTFPSPIYVGSLKSNVGHLEGASGIVSLIKTAMIVEKGFILPNCDFKKINEKIPLATWNMKVLITSFYQLFHKIASVASCVKAIKNRLSLIIPSPPVFPGWCFV